MSDSPTQLEIALGSILGRLRAELYSEIEERFARIERERRTAENPESLFTYSLPNFLPGRER